jgi:hypothetical protein
MAEKRFKYLFGSMNCAQYDTEAKFYIQEGDYTALRNLIVQYEKGGFEGRPEFMTAIPNDWTMEDISNLLLANPRDGKHPIWEVAARAYGRSTLFRWWKREKIN